MCRLYICIEVWNPECQWQQAMTKGKAKTGQWQLTRIEAVFFHLHACCQSIGEKLKRMSLWSWLFSTLCRCVFGNVSLTLPFGMAICSPPVLIHSQLLNATNSNIILYLSSTLQALLWSNKPLVLRLGCQSCTHLWGRCRPAVFFGILRNKWIWKSHSWNAQQEREEKEPSEPHSFGVLCLLSNESLSLRCHWVMGDWTNRFQHRTV